MYIDTDITHTQYQFPLLLYGPFMASLVHTIDNLFYKHYANCNIVYTIT